MTPDDNATTDSVSYYADLQLGHSDPEFMGLINTGPVLPPSRAGVAAWMKPDASPLPKFAICEKPAESESNWPKNVGQTDDFFKSAPPAIGFAILQSGIPPFNYKTRCAYIGLSIADEQHRGKGYGTEVMEWVLDYVGRKMVDV